MPESVMATRNEIAMPMARQIINFKRMIRNTIIPNCLFTKSPVNKFDFHNINRYAIKNVRIEKKEIFCAKSIRK